VRGVCRLNNTGQLDSTIFLRSTAPPTGCVSRFGLPSITQQGAKAIQNRSIPQDRRAYRDAVRRLDKVFGSVDLAVRPTSHFCNLWQPTARGKERDRVYRETLRCPACRCNQLLRIPAWERDTHREKATISISLRVSLSFRARVLCFASASRSQHGLARAEKIREALLGCFVRGVLCCAVLCCAVLCCAVGCCGAVAHQLPSPRK
jgi:hypothetical protein